MKSTFGRLVVASLLSAVILFVFGFLYWTMVPMPSWGNQNIPELKLDNFNDAVKTLEQGTYVTQPYTGEAPEIFTARVAEQPVVYLSIDPDGVAMPDMMGLAEGFLHAWLAALIVAALLVMAAPALCTFKSRFCFVALVGFFASFWCQIGDSIWWFRSCGSTTWIMIYDIISWILAAVVLAAMIKKPAEKQDGGS